MQIMRTSLLVVVTGSLWALGCSSSSSDGSSAAAGGTTCTGGSAVGKGGTTSAGGAASAGAGGGTAGSGVAGSGTGGATAGSGGSNGGSGGSTGGSAGAGGDAGAGGSGTAGSGGASPIVLGGARPVTLHVPPQYDGAKPLPLFVMLHGYGAAGPTEDAYLRIAKQGDVSGYFTLTPTGTTDASGKNFWNATDACCGAGSTVDDDGYLMGLVTEASAKVKVDPKKIFFVGHSNGGFMSYRLACNHADVIAGIAVLAGEMWQDVTKCNPSAPVSLLHIQGTADMTIPYGGGMIGTATFPGAVQSTADWVKFDSCTPTGDTSSPPFDLDTSLAGAETDITKWSGCKQSTAVELWTINGGGHIPVFGPNFGPDVAPWLLAHPKP
jgi:polyhydroxybutyrate depolymerase